MLGQVQGATSGTLGHMTHGGAKALGCVWWPCSFQQSTLKCWVPGSAVFSEPCNLPVLIHTTSWITDLAASGTLGYGREAANVHGTDLTAGKHQAGSKQEWHTQQAWPMACTQTCPSRGTGGHTQSSIQQHGKGLEETPQWFPGAPKYRDARVKLPSKQH